LKPQDIRPYIVPLSAQASEVAQDLLDNFKPAQRWLFRPMQRQTPIRHLAMTWFC